MHLRVDRDRALLADIGVMSLSQAEADELAATLNRHFAEDGWRIHPLEPGRWLLQLEAAAAASFTPCRTRWARTSTLTCRGASAAWTGAGC